jgi:penicillin-binding protein 2
VQLHEPQPLSNWRIALLGLLFLAGLTLLAARLYRLQVVQSDTYEQRQLHQSVRRVLLPSPRGRILDCHGRLLADNQPNYCLALYLEELRRPGRWSNTVNAVELELDRLAVVLQLPRACSRESIADHVAHALPLPLVAWAHLDETALARFVECRTNFPGVDVLVQPERLYPQGRLAAHVLGYVGRGDLAEAIRSEDYHYQLPGLKGGSGLEKEYDDLLCGLPGGQLIRVDAVGYRHDEWTARQPVPGHDLTLTLDSEIQKSLEDVLAGVRGAGVVLDPRNGDILAMASAPAFDPNTLSPASSETWRALIDDPERPLINRAIAGRYPPGSTFKPFVAVAALTLGNLPSSTTYVCDGTFHLGNRPIQCANGERHGAVDLRKAIEVSCNVYFCNLARDMGYDAIWSVAQQAGFGRRAGIDLPGETTGLLPSKEWKQEHKNEAWSVGDTCNVAIGQGDLQVSPLQMAVATAALANGGKVLRPRLLRGGAPEGDVINRTGWPAAAVELVRAGMQDVVSGEEGTGHRAQVAGMNIAAKTGTAQYRVDGLPKKYGWMISFAPAEAPRVVVVMVVEEAQTGGLTVGPRLQRVLLTIFANEIAAGGKARTT